jgi:DNA-binding transcriptional MerR regulator
MSAIDQTPTYNLGAVLRETGLKADTLRAWERRHGLPRPSRSEGGHRIYSQRDLETIKWLMARQGEGLSIGRAVALWHSLEAEGQDPLQVRGYTTPGAPAAAVLLPEADTSADLRREWVSACKAFDEGRAEMVLAQAFAKHPVEVVCLELLQKGLAELGEGWYRGRVVVQQEHFASGLAMRRLQTLVAATPPPSRPERILIGCPPREEHTFSALLLALLLRRRGWDVVYLGANVPTERLGQVIDSAKPHLVILAAQQLPTAATTLDMARLVRAEGVRLCYGGRAFNVWPQVRTRIPGHFLGERLDLVPPLVKEILSSPRPVPLVATVPAIYERALPHYRDRRGQIEAQVWRTMEAGGMRREHLVTATQHLRRDIVAGLALGDMRLVDSDVDWVSGLLSHHGLPGEVLGGYLAAYHQAAQSHLDERGAPLVDWLGQAAGLQGGG